MKPLLPLGLAVLIVGCAQTGPRGPASQPPAAVRATASAPRILADADLATLRATTARAFRERDFTALETAAAALRADGAGARTPAGEPALLHFYGGFTPAALALSREDAAAGFAAWRETLPTSPTRAAAEALYWRSQDGRGASPASRTSWARARRAALDGAIPASSCPQLAVERHRLLTSREQDRADADRLYAEAAAVFPGYAPLVEAHAGWLSGFADVEVGPWLDTAADRVGGVEGDELYARVAVSRPRSTFDWIERRRLEWPRIQRGLLSLHARWPAATGVLDRLAQAAESHDDRAVLRDTLLRLGDAPHRPTWSYNLGAYLRARRRAGLEAPSDLRPVQERSLGTRGYRVAFSPDGATIIVGGARGELLAFSADDLSPRWDLKVSRWISSLAFSPDGALLAATGGHYGDRDGGAVWVWNARTRLLLASDEAQPARLNAASFSPDGRYLWVGGGDQRGLLLRWSPGEPAFTRLAAPEGAISTLVATPDAVLFAARRTIWRLGAQSPDLPAEIIRDDRVAGALALSPDQHQLALGGWHENAAWQQAASVTVLPVETEQAADAAPATDAARQVRGTRVEALAFSRDGRLLVAASSAADFNLWRLPATEPALRAHVDDAWTIDDLTLSPDARTVATVDTSGHLRLWRLPEP